MGNVQTGVFLYCCRLTSLTPYGFQVEIKVLRKRLATCRRRLNKTGLGHNDRQSVDVVFRVSYEECLLDMERKTGIVGQPDRIHSLRSTARAGTMAGELNGGFGFCHW